MIDVQKVKVTPKVTLNKWRRRKGRYKSDLLVPLVGEVPKFRGNR